MTGLEFGNTELVSISGEKFYDKDLSGTDNGDDGIPGWTINYKITLPNSDVIEDSVTTDSNGNFSIKDIPIGSSFELSEELGGVNWLQTAPPGNLLADTIQLPNLAHYTVAYNHDDVVDQRFGNVLQAKLTGVKFYDKDMIGQFHAIDATPELLFVKAPAIPATLVPWP